MLTKIKNFGSLILKYSIGIGFVIWLLNTNQLNFNSLSLIDMTTFTWAFSLCILQFILGAYRVKILLKAHQINVSFYKCVLYNSVGIYYSLLLPGGISGDAVRAYYFWRNSDKQYTDKAALMGSLITDRLIGTLILLFVGLIAISYSYQDLGISIQYISIIWLLFITGLFIYCVLCSSYKVKWEISPNLKFNRIGKRITRLLTTLDLTSYRRDILLNSILISIVIHILTVMIIFIFAHKLRADLYFTQIMAVAPVGLLVNSLPLSPGGLGVGEQSFELLFSMIGGHHGGDTFMLSRLFLYCPAILGLLFSITTWKRAKKIEQPTILSQQKKFDAVF